MVEIFAAVIGLVLALYYTIINPLTNGGIAQGGG